MNKVLFFILLSLNFVIGLNAQITENYFSDTEPKDGGKIECFINDGSYIYLAGLGTEISMNHPFVSKIDTSGNEIWNTADNDTLSYEDNSGYVNTFMKSNSYIYAFVIGSFNNYYPTYQLWKIDETNGHILWRKNINAVFQYQKFNIIDYNSNKLILYFASLNNSSTQIFINKSNGNVLNTKITGRIGGYAVDSNNDIYYTISDTVYKYSGSNTNNLLWSKSYSSLNIGNYKKIYIDQNDSIYLIGVKAFSTNEDAYVLSINATTGNLNWSTNHYYLTAVFPTDLVDKSGYLYFTWKSTYAGGGTRYSASKVNKQTGALEWYKKYLFSGSSTFGYGNNGQKGALSIDADSNGDAYLTGYYGTYSSENKGAWGILKLNGNNGNVIYNATITQDSSIHDQSSCGIGSMIINNKAYFVGNLETDTATKLTRNCLIKMDPSTANIIDKKLLGGTYQEPSFTKSIKSLDNNNIAVLKQIGKKVKLEVYDINKTLQWSKEYTNEVFLNAFDIQVNNQGNLYLCVYSNPYDYYAPYYKPNVVNKIYIYSMDQNGQAIDSLEFSNSNVSSLVELYCDNNNSGYVLFKQGDNIRYRKFQNDSIYNIGNGGSDYNDTHLSKKIIYNFDMNYFGLINTGMIDVDLVKISKNTCNVINSETIELPFVYKSYYVEELNSDTIIILGKRQDKDFIIAFSKSAGDTVWTKRFNNLSVNLYKLIIDNNGKYFYTLGEYNNNVNIKKINGTNGNQLWNYNYHESNSLKSRGKEIYLDTVFGHLIYSGYNTFNTNGKVHNDIFINIIDTLGNNPKSYKRNADFIGDEAAISIGKSGKTIWIGGNMNHANYGKAGFLYYLDTNIFINKSIADSVCFSYTSPSGNHVWNSSGNYSDTIFSSYGKDTIYNIDLSVTDINTNVYVYDSLLISSQSNASYQWIDCVTMQYFPNDTSDVFVAQFSGSYAVIIDYMGCVDTSDCIDVVINSLDDLQDEIKLEISPNPSSNFINIKTNEKLKSYEIRNLSGKSVLRSKYTSAKINLNQLSTGNYYIIFFAERNKVIIRKLVIL